MATRSKRRLCELTFSGCMCGEGAKPRRLKQVLCVGRAAPFIPQMSCYEMI